jgi:hypothetical protein
MTRHRNNWFERNPVKTLLIFFLVALLGLVTVTEKILASRSPRYPTDVKRYIRVRDYLPSYSASFTPGEDDLKNSDTLVKRPYKFRTDENGLVMPAKIHDHPDVTLVFLGGSTTLCAYVDEEKRFPYLAGRLLEKRSHRKVNSYNAGMGGNNSLHSINILYNKIIPLKPNVAIMMHNINDLNVLLEERSYWNRHPNLSPIVEVRSRDCFRPKEIITLLIPNLYEGLKNMERMVRRKFFSKPKQADDEFRDIRGKKIVIDPPQLLQQFNRNLQTFINLCRAWDIVPVLMTMENRLKENPDAFIAQMMSGFSRKTGISYKEYKEIFDRFNQAIREVGLANGILVIDLARKIPQENEFMYDVVHFTDGGSQLAARVISDDLQPVIDSLGKRLSD